MAAAATVSDRSEFGCLLEAFSDSLRNVVWRQKMALVEKIKTQNPGP